MAADQGNIADIRKDYQLATLDESVAGDDPLLFFKKWFDQAVAAHADEVNAMTVATVSNGKPHARIVLLKGLDHKGFVFFTNYDSHKGQEIASNPNVATVFFWKELERQVRVEGIIEKVIEGDSDTYFHSRPEGSQLGAWASPQSSVIANREVLDDNYEHYKSEFGNNIPRPPHWGGYCIVPQSIEFWQGRSSRMHDRILFTLENGTWVKNRLAP
ncbi:MAG: pyridoxamine 5'-phosphate oxidase [Sphingobacteriales bacterium]|nr:MAG: pyridoxamine 5'-phosphate oxidase [Sphingobacteriales bacterium]